MTITIKGEEYLSAGEAAGFLGVSAATFKKFQRERHLQALRRPGLGQRKFFKKKDLEPLLEFYPVDGQEDGQHGGTAPTLL